MKKYLSMLAFLIVGTLLTQGFQCKSPEMTTAIIASNNKDWAKAEKNLEIELKKNPGNLEAVVYLIQARTGLKDCIGAANLFSENEKKLQDPELTRNIAFNYDALKYNLWADNYTAGVKSYNQYLKDKRQSQIDSSISFMKLAYKLRSNNPDIIKTLALFYIENKDTANNIEFSKKYYESIKSEIEFGLSKGIFINSVRYDLSKNLAGKLDSSVVDTIDRENNYLRKTDYYKYGMNDVKVWSDLDGEKNKDAQFIVKGWRSFAPKGWTNEESLNSISYSTEPMFNLASYYNTKKDYEKVIQYLTAALSLEPTNKDANAWLVQVYTIQGKKDQAFKFVTDLLEKDPNNPIYISLYAEMLMQADEYDKAITNYEKVVKLDPKNDIAVRNLAAAYKNQVVNIQAKQRDMATKDPNYKADKNEYEPLLVKSADLFEKAKKFDNFKDDFVIYADLCQIYFVLGKTDKFDINLNELKAKENILDEKQKADYYNALLRIVDMTSNPEESERIMKMVEKYNKK